MDLSLVLYVFFCLLSFILVVTDSVRGTPGQVVILLVTDACDRSSCTIRLIENDGYYARLTIHYIFNNKQISNIISTHILFVNFQTTTVKKVELSLFYPNKSTHFDLVLLGTYFFLISVFLSKTIHIIIV